MNVLGIETSCDETALAALECRGNAENPHYRVLGEAVYSQIEAHRKYGGVFPALAKREHGRNLIPLFKKLLGEAGWRITPGRPEVFSAGTKEQLTKILLREPDLLKDFLEFIPTVAKPPVDAIAVTRGPGLEPALWVGINFARALAFIWNIPLVPSNHMEGHIWSVLLSPGVNAADIRFPVLALLVSGGHTELVLGAEPLQYELLGQTRDDAVGEAFDKVARILGLPYPGGPEISRLADEARQKEYPRTVTLPRPMLKSHNYDFSYSGLKTAVLYHVKNTGAPSAQDKATLAREFEDAAVEVLTEKTRAAMHEYRPHTLILGGGVTANRFLRARFETLMKEFPDVKLLIPPVALSTDNAVMIALAAAAHLLRGETGMPPLETGTLAAAGTLKLSETEPD